jgi:hypothetical protein
MKIYGMDLSLDHAGVVSLNKEGVVTNYLYTTTSKKLASVDSKHSYLLSKKAKDESKDVFRLRRMGEIAVALLNFDNGFFYKVTPSTYTSIEGYAYSSQTTSICQIAELTGFLKHMIFEGGGNIRIHDPLTVKLFAVNTGKCLKKDIVEKARIAFNIPEELIKKKKIKKKKGDEPIEEYDGPATDLADAYFLARMVQTELKLRKGQVTLAELPENERRIFLRVTKAYPVNILDRPFICKNQEK